MAPSWRPSDTNQAILHIGITDSQGVVYNFDTAGFVKDGASWSQCIVVPLALGSIGSESDVDNTLEAHRHDWCARGAGYHPTSRNCFDYVVSALNALAFMSETAWTKRSLARTVIRPALSAAVARESLDCLLHPAETSSSHSVQGAPPLLLLHESYTDFSCTVTPDGPATPTQFEKKDCPVCFDYSGWQADLRAERLKRLRVGLSSVGGDIDVDDDDDASGLLLHFHGAEELREHGAENEGGWD